MYIALHINKEASSAKALSRNAKEIRLAVLPWVSQQELVSTL